MFTTSKNRIINFRHVEEIETDNKGGITIRFVSGHTKAYDLEESKEILKAYKEEYGQVAEYNQIALEHLKKQANAQSFDIMKEVENFTKSDMFKDLVKTAQEAKGEKKETRTNKGKKFTTVETKTLETEKETTTETEETTDPATNK